MDEREFLELAQGRHFRFTDADGRLLRMVTNHHAYSWGGEMLSHDGECTLGNCEIEQFLTREQDGGSQRLCKKRD